MTDYQKAVFSHMATSPEELGVYVRERLTKSKQWVEEDNPISRCGFDWYESKEGVDFWNYVSCKLWDDAMDTEFWQSRKPTPSKEAREFWEQAFCAIVQSPSLPNLKKQNPFELADDALAAWQKRFEL